MKNLIIILLFLIVLPVNAQTCNVQCPSETLSVIEGETLLNKISGVSFASKKLMEFVIEKELHSLFEKSTIQADLDIFNISRLKKGEFKELILKTKSLRYKALSMSDFKAETICPFNKVLYQNKKVYFPMDIPFKFESYITNEDIKNILNSEEFQSELNKTKLKVNGKTTFGLETPIVEINNDLLNFTIPIKTFFSKKPLKIAFQANIEVENNNIVLRNITFNSKSNIINNDIFSPIINSINPISYQISSLSGKYFKMDVTSAKIVGNTIKTNGVFQINKNYGEGNE